MHDIDKKLVVEGVETEETMNVLRDMKCDYIQGFYYSKPLSEEERPVELARIMGSVNDPLAIQHARNLLRSARDT